MKKYYVSYDIENVLWEKGVGRLVGRFRYLGGSWGVGWVLGSLYGRIGVLDDKFRFCEVGEGNN